MVEKYPKSVYIVIHFLFKLIVCDKIRVFVYNKDFWFRNID